MSDSARHDERPGGDHAAVSGLDRLAAVLAAEGGLLAGAIAGDPGEHAALDAAGPRTTGREDEYALLLEAIREGALLHYGNGRVLATADADLALLAGDRLYAIGLDRLAALGDVAAVAELADVISLVAQAHAEDDPRRADAVWASGVRSVTGAG